MANHLFFLVSFLDSIFQHCSQKCAHAMCFGDSSSNGSGNISSRLTQDVNGLTWRRFVVAKSSTRVRTDWLFIANRQLADKNRQAVGEKADVGSYEAKTVSCVLEMSNVPEPSAGAATYDRRLVLCSVRSISGC